MDVVDLNNLVPNAVQVKIGDETLELQPPTVRALFTINKLSAMAGAKDSTPDDIGKFQDELKAELVKLCPGLEKHELNGTQLLVLAGTVIEMSNPQKQQEMAKATVDADKPASSEVKPDPKDTKE